jgi:L-threonylcarbamoyladenylate synthase
MRTIKGRMKAGHWALSREDYETVCEVLDAGKLIVYPTDTVYGLGCDPFEGPAVERVFDVKRRPAEQPIALALTTSDQIPKYAHVTRIAQGIIAKHLPGPVTLLLRATKDAPLPLVSSTGLLGIRVPDHSVAIAIAKAFGPITTTSANLHGGPSPVTCEDARAQLGEAVDLYIDCGPTPLGKESTIVDASGDSLKVIREGTLRREEL